MVNYSLTVRELLDLGLWSYVCEQKDWNVYIFNEGRIQEDEVVEFYISYGDLKAIEKQTVMDEDERIVIKGTFEHEFTIEDYPELADMDEDELEEWVEEFVSGEDLLTSGDFYSEYAIKKKWSSY